MFRVPTNPVFPTFDETEKISFRRWLTSKAEERKEWARRRNLAARTAQRNQDRKKQSSDSYECAICGETANLVYNDGWLCPECHADENEQ